MPSGHGFALKGFCHYLASTVYDSAGRIVLSERELSIYLGHMPFVVPKAVVGADGGLTQHRGPAQEDHGLLMRTHAHNHRESVSH